MKPFSLMVARFPALSQEHPESAGYVMGLMEKLHNDPKIDRIIPWRLSDTPITMSRNRCAKDALATKADYLLMIDADMSPDCEEGAPGFWETAWGFMMKRRHEELDWHTNGYSPHGVGTTFPPATIAAPYCGPPPHECVYVFRWAGKSTGDPDPSFKLEMFDRDDAARKTGIEEVAALPTGLILYDMRVFQQLPPPWFEYEWTDVYRTEKASTEDVFQTRNASLMGLPQYCAWDCWAGHVKSKVVRKPFPLTVKSMQDVYADAILRTREIRRAGKS